MKSVDRILVGLELKKSDLFLVEQVKNLAVALKPKKIDFIHVSEDLETNLPDVGKFTPRDEKLEQIMRDEVSLYFKDGEFDARFEVVEGNPVKQILHWSAVKNSDLIVLGRKNDKKHAEITLERIVTKAPCSVMIIPQNSPVLFDNILFPVDYSKKTTEGIQLLNDIFHSPKIEGIHFFELPTGYYKTGKTAEEFIEIMDKNAQKEAERITSILTEKNNLSFTNICSEGIDEFDYIIDYATKNKHNVIAIGSKGKTNAATILLGSFSEKFMRHNRTIPTLIFKEKGETLDFIKAFINL